MQIYVIVLAIILWGVGTEPRSVGHCSYIDIPEFGQSFLVVPNSPVLGISSQNDGNFLLNSPPQIPQFPRQSFLPFIIGVFRTRFPPRARAIIS